MLAYATFWFSLKCFFAFFGGAVMFKTLVTYARKKTFKTGNPALWMKFCAIGVGIFTVLAAVAMIVSFGLTLFRLIVQLTVQAAAAA